MIAKHRIDVGRVAGLLAALALPFPAASQQDGLAAARGYRERHAASILRRFSELLSLPNVAADSAGIWRNARHLERELTARGVRTELLTLPGAPPVVLGRWDVPGATRTIALYVHYDGQPTDTAGWTFGPWTPTLTTRALESGGTRRAMPADGEPVDPEWRLYARSAGDDKAPIAALLTVLDAFRERGVTPTSNLVFFFEGEEEAGSPRLGGYLRTFRDRLADIDVWLFLDGPVHQSGRPLIAFGVRGVAALEVTVYGANRSLHSGHYGNWAPVPGEMLARLLAGMKDDRGRVLIPGFYDSVEPLGPAERAALARLPAYDAELKRELGLARTEAEPAILAERLLLPALTIQGLASAQVGPLARNVIPDRATANIGLRLVKGNDPERMMDLVEAHIRAQGYHIIRDEPADSVRLAHPRLARVERLGGYPAARAPMDAPVVRDVVAAASRVSGDELVLLPGMGGSLPLYLFTGSGAEVLVVPVANYDDNQHAPDENLRIGNLWYAVDLYAALLTMPAPRTP
jgi:acetylornithine deacetylase/succinyl-diaminopimelate desuccinylase-like protein